MLLAFVMDIIVYLKSHRIDIDPENAVGAGGNNLEQNTDENLLKLRKIPRDDDDEQQTKIEI
jgi:hypothetical protein